MSIQETAAATSAAINAVDSNADPVWKAHADRAMAWCCERYETFTSDEVWAVLDTWNVARPKTQSALGPRFLSARKQGFISMTPDRRKFSVEKQKHHELTVWRSNVYVAALAS